MFRRASLLGLIAFAVATPLAAWGRLATMPLDVLTVAAPAAAQAPAPAAPLCHEATDELSAAGTCAICASCHQPTAASAPAATGSAPRPAERRSTRRQAERLDRPPFIRPM